MEDLRDSTPRVVTEEFPVHRHADNSEMGDLLEIGTLFSLHSTHLKGAFLRLVVGGRANVWALETDIREKSTAAPRGE